MRPQVIDVAATIVEDGSGRVLLAQRTARQLSPFAWELPGGKIEPGESADQAAARELFEETGLKAGALRRWIAYDHDFPTRRVRLQFFRAASWSGAPHGREGQRLAWVTPGAPEVGPLLPSNARVLAAFGLPRVIAVAGSAGGRHAAATLAGAMAGLAAGARLLLISEPMLTPDQRASLARRAVEHAHRYGARVVLEGGAFEVKRAGADAGLAGARELRRTAVRPPLDLWGARCRNAEDLARAVALGADFALLAPVLASLDATRPMGWPAFAALAAGAPIPVFAQGGMQPGSLGTARGAGGAGIAVNLAALVAAAAAAA